MHLCLSLLFGLSVSFSISLFLISSPTEKFHQQYIVNILFVWLSDIKFKILKKHYSRPKCVQGVNLENIKYIFNIKSFNFSVFMLSNCECSSGITAQRKKIRKQWDTVMSIPKTRMHSTLCDRTHDKASRNFVGTMFHAILEWYCNNLPLKIVP